MSALAVFLIAVGVADIARKLSARRWPALVAGPSSVIVAAAAAGLWHLGDVVLLAFGAAVSVIWVILSDTAERTGEREGHALGVFCAGGALIVAFGGWASPVAGPLARWLPWAGLTGVEPGLALMVAGIILLQLVTANQLVRLILGAVGAVRPAGVPQPSDRLKGGRLLGPMERLLIVGLALGGQFGAASAVIAAKGIIRFPELAAARKDAGTADPQGPGIDEVTEYFLVGSFASWLIALAGLALTMV
ncbi:hypothetical protein FK535_08140 [Mycolicibacterium sp. 018/SC-01/001]|uniref:hypothetical protein n=1 Tax=Mycolicibacterium sp. 018/SC-01/001 TaxID=2592069 RepID=UPI00117EF158|nr:hypothetical protein [Mycolicibacterium sp. 018/SC-01/001]TRW85370.1 hypothetical protein FK535_08140 [Mycolicibacterium sp. 018/SC-01/001]